MQSSTFLGTGMSFPPEIDTTTGRFKMCSDEEDIKQSIYIILATRKNERVMMPEFGCNIHDYVFELPDAGTMAALEDEIMKSIVMWEPRVIKVEIDIDDTTSNDGKVVISINYVVRATNNPNNLVFPYYLYEGVGNR